MSARPAPFSQVRPMKQADVEAVSDIEKRSYVFPWTPGIFRDCMRAGHQCWVLDSGEALMGYGVLSAAAGEAHILNLCIAPEYQGRGHGRRLLRRLLDLARWHKAGQVFLEVRPSNPRAIQLYREEGFNEIGHRPNYYPAEKGREDAIVMALELLPPDRDWPPDKM
jgi:ribosomal-protein-alanine N-acetyltransferase